MLPMQDTVLANNKGRWPFLPSLQQLQQARNAIIHAASSRVSQMSPKERLELTQKAKIAREEKAR